MRARNMGTWNIYIKLETKVITFRTINKIYWLRKLHNSEMDACNRQYFFFRPLKTTKFITFFACYESNNNLRLFASFCFPVLC